GEWSSDVCSSDLSQPFVSVHHLIGWGIDFANALIRQNEDSLRYVLFALIYLAWQFLKVQQHCERLFCFSLNDDFEKSFLKIVAHAVIVYLLNHSSLFVRTSLYLGQEFQESSLIARVSIFLHH